MSWWEAARGIKKARLPLRVIYPRVVARSLFNPQELEVILHKLFGEQGARIAGILVKYGPEGITKALEEVKNQASLTERIKALLESLSSKWEAAMGNVQNALAEIGGAIADDLKQIVDSLGDWAATAQGWVRDHKELVHWAAIAIGVFGVFAVALGTAAMALSVLGSGAVVVSAAAAVMGTAALYVWRHWDEVAKWLGRLWSGLAKHAQWQLPLLAMGAALVILFAPITSLITAVLALGAAA
jgi:hypothetical protein